MSEDSSTHRGLLPWFIRNNTTANLLFIFFLVSGAFSLLNTRMEIFPDVTPDIVTVRVPYPGATPQEVEDGVLLRIENALEDVEGVREISGTAAQNMGVVVADIEYFANRKEVLDDIQDAVDRIDDFPPEVEEPIVTDPPDRRSVLILAIYGDGDRHTLKEVAKEIRDDLIISDTISTIEIVGITDYEISVELEEEALRRYNITFAEVAQRIAQTSFDLPAGTVKTDRSSILVRTTAQAYHADEVADLVLRSGRDGGLVRIRDVATVVEKFEDDDYEVEFDGNPAVLLQFFRIGHEEALQVEATVRQWLADNEDRFPPGIMLALFNNNAEPLRSTLGLLLRNAALGLVLVLIVLGLFLETRTALWAAGGIMMSFIGAVAFLPFFDVAINQVSLFAFILVLGLVVDNSIVVGENIHQHREVGLHRQEAAIQAVREVVAPVALVVLSTVVVFVPMLYVRGEVGQALMPIPIVVISVLLLALLQALLILPSQISRGTDGTPGKMRRTTDKARDYAGRGLQWLIDKPLHWLVGLSIRWRYAAVAAAVALLIVTSAYNRADLIEWRFFPDVHANHIIAALDMPAGTSAEQTRTRVERIAQAARELKSELENDGTHIVRHIVTAVSSQPLTQASPGQQNGMLITQDSRLGEVGMILVDADQREIDAGEILAMWRERVGELPGIRTLSFNALMFDLGPPISIRLGHDDFDILQEAADELEDELRRFAGVHAIRQSYVDGNPQIEITGLKPQGYALGYDLREVARQVRGAFFGLEAQRIQRGWDQLRIYVRYPEAARDSIEAVGSMFIRTLPFPAGNDDQLPAEAPLGQIADLQLTEGIAQLTRANRQRAITVSADVDEQVTNAAQINRILREQVLSGLTERHERLRWTYTGQREEEEDALGSLGLGMLIALLAVYFIMAAQFGSYLQPMVVMMIIPLGVVGAIWGHVLLDIRLSFMSVFGMVALAGVVVNAALLLIDLINRNRESGVPAYQAAYDAAMRRARPILLTTLTTFFALLPMIFERSLLGRFLIPTAVSLGFGVLFASLVTILLVPATYLIIEDIRALLSPAVGKGDHQPDKEKQTRSSPERPEAVS